MSEIEAVRNGRLALAQPGATISAVAVAVLNDGPQDEPKAPAAPKSVALTDELVQALNELPEVFGQVQPGEVRMISDEESALLRRERDAINKILKSLETRKTAIGDAVQNHMDLKARADGRANDDTQVDARGHFVLARKGAPEQLPIPGSNEVWSREYRDGKVEIDGGKLEELHAQDKVSREDYLAFTRSVRVFDEDKAFKAMADDPDRIKIFRQLVTRGRPSTALFVRKQ